jgi:hypothetical protein
MKGQGYPAPGFIVKIGKSRSATGSRVLPLWTSDRWAPPYLGIWPTRVLGPSATRYVDGLRTALVERNPIYAGTQAGLRPTRAAPQRLPGTAHAGTTIYDVTAKGRRDLLATVDPGPGSAAPGSRSARKPTETGGSYAPGGRPAAPSGRALWAFRHRRIAGSRRNGRGLLSARYRIEPFLSAQSLGSSGTVLWRRPMPAAWCIATSSRRFLSQKCN